MDVVKRSISKIGGSIVIESELGKGTTFTISIPYMASTSIINGLVARVGNTHLIFPIYSVSQTLSFVQSKIQKINGNEGEFIVFQDNILPIFRLTDIFKIASEKKHDSKEVIFVVRVKEKQFGLVADELQSQQQVVVESLKEQLNGLVGISGGAILGNGKFSMILNIESIYKHWCVSHGANSI